jgi:copper chaperone
MSRSVNIRKGIHMDFKVPDMSCGHCTSAIEKSVKSADPAAQIACDLGTRVVHIDSALNADQLSAAIKDAGYESTAV